ncbi:MAG: WG repeat-containing protein [Spirochaetes bacterium]|nr:WG repeat-containing protein [Spirochaetota bacterium]
MKKINFIYIIIFLISIHLDVFSFNQSLYISPQKDGNGKWGYVNENGRYVIKPRFEEAWDFIDGLARIRICSKYGFINEKGRPKIRPMFDNARDFSEGLAAVMVYNSASKAAWGYIDTKGRFVIKPQYEEAADFSDGKALVKNGDNVFYIDRMGESVSI